MYLSFKKFNNFQIIIILVIGVCSTARLDHLEPSYLPPEHRGFSQESAFSSASGGFDGSANALSQASTGFGGSFQSRFGTPGRL